MLGAEDAAHHCSSLTSTAGRHGAGPNEAALRALEALRQDWIAREIAKNAPELPRSSTSGHAAG